MHRSHLLGGGFFIGGKIAFVKFAPAKFFRPSVGFRFWLLYYAKLPVGEIMAIFVTHAKYLDV